ncbi:hypothetical protein J3458_004146 [Metarhizium acridum]|uniref:uncharacterized protein n=1 Tax=Metarhizium acridum TaxID=92637 RepID=UPI001C6BD6B4|nr:hypothetical protein J3458_004146 [Metarhizium acridum]
MYFFRSGDYLGTFPPSSEGKPGVNGGERTESVQVRWWNDKKKRKQFEEWRGEGGVELVAEITKHGHHADQLGKLIVDLVCTGQQQPLHQPVHVFEQPNIVTGTKA